MKKRGAPHIGRYTCMIRCRLDASLRRALDKYCEMRGIGICDAIRLAIFALVSHDGAYDALLDAEPEANRCAYSKSSTRVSGAQRS